MELNISTELQNPVPDESDSIAYPVMDVFNAGLRNHHIANTAYPIHHERTFKPYRVRAGKHESVIRKAYQSANPMLLYVHIPFCETRCSFCEYTVTGKSEHSLEEEYVNALLKEIDFYSDRFDFSGKSIEGLDIGGGTPAFIQSAHIGKIIDSLSSRFRFSKFEPSIETTPRIAAADVSKLRDYKSFGIHRISMGVQVTQADLLRELNRETNGQDTHLQAVEKIRAAGFHKFNIDLMYGFANQTLKDWEVTLRHTIALQPEYITLYRMRYKLTRISTQSHRVSLANVKQQSAIAREILQAAGYDAPIGKNTFSKIAGDDGTSDYIHKRVKYALPYFGFGLGAQSYSDHTISYNSGALQKSLKPYFRKIEKQELPIQDLYHLPARQIAAKMIAVSFYFGGIHLPSFETKTGQRFEEMFRDATKFLIENRYMKYTEDRESFVLTAKGDKYYNGVIALFYAPSVQKYLIDRNPQSAEDMVRNQKLARSIAKKTA